MLTSLFERKKMKKIAAPICVILVAVLLVSGCSPVGGETVLEYKGYKISEAMYGYWVALYKRDVIYSFNNRKDTSDFWQSEVSDGVTTEDYFTDIINNQIYKYCIGQQLFDEYGLKLEKEVKTAIDADINEKIEYYGSRAELNSALAHINLNIELLREIYICEEKLKAVYNYLYGPYGPEALSDNDYVQYFKDNYWHMKYIVIYTTKLATDSKGNYKYDSSGTLVTEPLTEEEFAEKLAKAEEALAKAQAGEDFDELIITYSEYDTTAYPSGFYVSVNELSTYGANIVSALAEMQVGEVRRVEEGSAIYIIKKLELPEWGQLTESELLQLVDLEEYAKAEAFDAKLNALFPELKVNNEVLGRYRLSEIKMLSIPNI
jgi:hypothetical protein